MMEVVLSKLPFIMMTVLLVRKVLLIRYVDQYTIYT